MKTIATKLALALAMLGAAGIAGADESKVQIKDGSGKDKAMQCMACHSIDYIPMNSAFLNKTQWTATVNKMIKVFGAPISEADVEPIAAYLAQNYGVEEKK